MFDFLRDTMRETYLEMNGIKIDENSRRIKKNKKGEIVYLEEEDKIILKRKTKMTLFGVGVLLVLLNVFGIYFALRISYNMISLVRFILLLVMTVPTLVLLCIKTKKCEIASIVLMCLIFLLYFLPF